MTLRFSHSCGPGAKDQPVSVHQHEAVIHPSAGALLRILRYAGHTGPAEKNRTQKERGDEPKGMEPKHSMGLPYMPIRSNG